MAPEVPHPRLTRRDAATREGRRCPRVRPCHATWLLFFQADSRRRGFDSGRFTLNRAVSAETADSGRNSKKKKKVQNAPFEQNIKPSFSSLHTNTPNSALCLSLSLSLTRLSLSVCSLPLSLLAVRQSASAESIT